MIKYSLYSLVACVLFLPILTGHRNVKKETTLPRKQVLLWSADWSADDQLIAVGGDDSLLKIYDSRNLKLFKSYRIQSMIRQLRWHPQKNNLAIATNDDAVSILDTKTGTFTKLSGIKYGARGIGWNFNGQLLATADNDGQVKIWNDSGKLLRVIKNETGNSFFSLDWHPQKNLIAVSGDDVRIFDTAGKLITRFQHRKENTGVLAIRWHPSGDLFATADYGHDKDGIPSILQFWKQDGTLIKTLNGSKAEYRNVQWNKKGTLLASASDALRIWDRDGKLLFTGRSEDLLWGLDWNSQSTQLITTSLNGHIKRWTAQAKLLKEASE